MMWWWISNTVVAKQGEWEGCRDPESSRSHVKWPSHCLSLLGLQLTENSEQCKGRVVGVSFLPPFCSDSLNMLTLVVPRRQQQCQVSHANPAVSHSKGEAVSECLFRMEKSSFPTTSSKRSFIFQSQDTQCLNQSLSRGTGPVTRPWGWDWTAEDQCSSSREEGEEGVDEQPTASPTPSCPLASKVHRSTQRSGQRSHSSTRLRSILGLRK